MSSFKRCGSCKGFFSLLVWSPGQLLNSNPFFLPMFVMSLCASQVFSSLRGKKIRWSCEFFGHGKGYINRLLILNGAWVGILRATIILLNVCVFICCEWVFNTNTSNTRRAWWEQLPWETCPASFYSATREKRSPVNSQGINRICECRTCFTGWQSISTTQWSC